MKKRCMYAAIAAIVAVGAAFGFDKQAEKAVSTELVIANIEALTYDEWGYDSGCVANGDGCMIRYNHWYTSLLPKD